MMPKWLQYSICGVVATTAALTIGSWAVCSPAFRAQFDGREPESCKLATEKALGAMSALLATLVSLASQPPVGP